MADTRPRTHRRNPGRPRVRTSWDPIADWYVGWVGEEGSKHHRHVAIPALLELLEPRPGEQVLDVGCGPGVLAPPVAAAGARYTGVDASAKLIDYAREHHAGEGRFLVGDARRLQQVRGIAPGAFDAVTFLLSLHDMDPLAPVLASAAWALRDGGRLVALLTHPCFRVPRQSGWGWDEGRKLRYRRVDRYLTPLAVPLTEGAARRGGVTRSRHRPLEAYVNGLAAAGLLVDALREIPTYKTASAGERARAENLANREIPLFLALRARKLPGAATIPG
jgi:SAM-dependent methyltransferase